MTSELLCLSSVGTSPTKRVTYLVVMWYLQRTEKQLLRKFPEFVKETLTLEEFKGWSPKKREELGAFLVAHTEAMPGDPDYCAIQTQRSRTRTLDFANMLTFAFVKTQHLLRFKRTLQSTILAHGCPTDYSTTM